MMDVILLERIEKLGQMGDVVSVRPGYARNYLLPQNKAMRATKENRERFESQRAQLEAENLERRGEAEAVAGRMDGLRITLIRQAGETGQLYGSVSARDLADSVTESGFTIDRGQVLLERTIKHLGLHTVRIRLHPEVIVPFVANVARSEEEAKIQEETGMRVTAEDQRAAEDAAIDEAIALAEQEEAAEDAASDDAEPATAEEPSPQA